MEDLNLAMVFGEWAAAERFTNEPVGANVPTGHFDQETSRAHDDELARRCDKAAALACQLAAIPAAGLTGFVLQSVVLVLCSSMLEGPCASPERLVARALLADAVRLVPDLRHCPVFSKFPSGAGL